MTSPNTEEECKEFKNNIEVLTNEIARLSNQYKMLKLKNKKINLEKKNKRRKNNLYSL